MDVFLDTLLYNAHRHVNPSQSISQVHETRSLGLQGAGAKGSSSTRSVFHHEP